MKRAILVMVAVTLVALAAPQAWAANAGDNIFFSTSATNPDPIGNPGNLATGIYNVGNGTFTLPAGTSTLYVWITSAASFADDVTPQLINNGGIDPTNGAPNSGAGLAVNYSLSGGGNITGVTIPNPVVNVNGNLRWEQVSSFSGSATSVVDMNAVTKPVDSTPGGPGHIGNGVFRGISQQNTDPMSVTVSGGGTFSNGATKAFMLESITVNSGAAPTGTLAVLPSTKLIVQGIVGGATSVDMTNFYTYGTASLTFASATRLGDLSTNGTDSTPDGNINDHDIDKLYADIRNLTTNVATEDLNGDLVVNQKDVDHLVNTLVDLNGVPNGSHGTSYGDADLNGSVGGADFNAFLNRPTNGWASGDWDGSGTIGGADFNLFLNRPSSIAGGAPPLGGGTVPEPGSICLMAMGGIALLAKVRRARKS